MIIYTKCIIHNNIGYYTWTHVTFHNTTEKFYKGFVNTSKLYKVYKIMIMNILQTYQNIQNRKLYIVIHNNYIYNNIKKKHSTMRWNIIHYLLHDDVSFTCCKEIRDKSIYEQNIYDFMNCLLMQTIQKNKFLIKYN